MVYLALYTELISFFAKEEEEEKAATRQSGTDSELVRQSAPRTVTDIRLVRVDVCLWSYATNLKYRFSIACYHITLLTSHNNNNTDNDNDINTYYNSDTYYNIDT